MTCKLRMTCNKLKYFFVDGSKLNGYSGIKVGDIHSVTDVKKKLSDRGAGKTNPGMELRCQCTPLHAAVYLWSAYKADQLNISMTLCYYVEALLHRAPKTCQLFYLLRRVSQISNALCRAVRRPFARVVRLLPIFFCRGTSTTAAMLPPFCSCGRAGHVIANS